MSRYYSKHSWEKDGKICSTQYLTLGTKWEWWSQTNNKILCLFQKFPNIFKTYGCFTHINDDDVFLQLKCISRHLIKSDIKGCCHVTRFSYLVLWATQLINCGLFIICLRNCTDTPIKRFYFVQVNNKS